MENYKQLQRDFIKLQERFDALLRLQLNTVNFGCPDCGAELHWESDVDMDDFMDEPGIISFYHCCNCNLEVEVRRYDNAEECSCKDNYDETF